MKTRKIIGVFLLAALLCGSALPAMAITPDTTTEYAVNSNGETYGNHIQAMELGYEADLILAEGESGVLGYVRASNLDGQGSGCIPLYTSDGETVIGQYTIGTVADEQDQSRTAYTYGNTGLMQPAGYNGYSKSAIKGSTFGVTAKTEVTTSKIVAVNWIGIQARVYNKSTGALVDNSAWKYNSEATDSFSVSVYHMSFKTSTEYYSSGYVKLWNPDISDYWTYSTFDSPIAKPST